MRGKEMKKSTCLLTHFILLLSLACAPLYSQVVLDGQRIYQGLSADSVIRRIGEPDVVSSGPYTYNADKFIQLNLTQRTMEWVYVGPEISTVIFLEDGIVRYIGQIPTKKVRRSF